AEDERPFVARTSERIAHYPGGERRGGNQRQRRRRIDDAPQGRPTAANKVTGLGFESEQRHDRIPKRRVHGNVQGKRPRHRRERTLPACSHGRKNGCAPRRNIPYGGLARFPAALKIGMRSPRIIRSETSSCSSASRLRSSSCPQSSFRPVSAS